MDEETWKVIKDFDTHEVSTMGRVKNIKSGSFLKGSLNAGGYRCVSLMGKSMLVHVLVADAFLKGENTVINHINGKKDDNRLENLERMTQSQNMKHAYDTGLFKAYSRPVKVFLNSEFLKEFISIKEASDELKLDASSVSACLKNQKPHKGYTFKYSEEPPVSEEISGEIWKQYKDTKYYISDQGRIKSSYDKIMRHQKDLAGYCRVQLRIEKKQTTFLVHRLVAEVYCLNPESLETVDHINGNASDNRAINLRYVSRTDNSRLANCIPVDQIELSSGKVLKTWPSATDAARELKGVDQRNLSAVCLNKPWFKTAGGYGWRFSPT